LGKQCILVQRNRTFVAQNHHSIIMFKNRALMGH